MSATTHAMQTLVKLTALSSHEQLIDKAVNFDSHHISDEILDSWNWSSGESVLVGILKVIARGHGDVELSDLYRLDKPNQAATLLALSIRFGITSEFGETWSA